MLFLSIETILEILYMYVYTPDVISGHKTFKTGPKTPRQTTEKDN